MLIKKNDKVLFLGDSITDDGRVADKEEGLGFGYVRYIRDMFVIKYPEYNVDFINRGVSGYRVIDLNRRLKNGVVHRDATVISISIGINDVWRQLDHLDAPVYIDEFEETYREMLDKIRKNTDARLILMETSVVGEDIQSEGNRLLVPYNACIHRLAKEYNALLVPINQAFKKHIEKAPEFKLTIDGVHLSSLGKTLFAVTWLEAIGYQ
jgi:acyl-CoA thioesterase-1